MPEKCMETSTEAIRDSIIVAALPDVPFDGWTRDTLRRAAQAAGYEAEMAAAVFPGGPAEALDHFSDWADRRMLDRLSDTDPAALRVRDRIRAALFARFDVLGPHKESLRLAMIRHALPTRSAASARALWRTADQIWTWAGDQSTDYNRYTKRGLLCGILASAALYWLNDDGSDQDATKAYIDRRIETVMKLGMFLGRFKQAGRPA